MTGTAFRRKQNFIKPCLALIIFLCFASGVDAQYKRPIGRAFYSYNRPVIMCGSGNWSPFYYLFSDNSFYFYGGNSSKDERYFAYGEGRYSLSNGKIKFIFDDKTIITKMLITPVMAKNGQIKILYSSFGSIVLESKEGALLALLTCDLDGIAQIPDSLRNETLFLKLPITENENRQFILKEWSQEKGVIIEPLINLNRYTHGFGKGSIHAYRIEKKLPEPNTGGYTGLSLGKDGVFKLTPIYEETRNIFARVNN